MADLSRQTLLDLAQAIVAVAPDTLRLACNEDDASSRFDAEAAHFIKVHERRLGRDIELYYLMSVGPARWEGSLAMFFEEVVLPLKHTAPTGYRVACDELKKLGEKVYSPDLLGDWNALLAM